jgi:hypothetical protein
MPVLKHVDLLLLVLALPVFLLAGFPIGGYITGAIAWLLQKGIKEYSERKARETDDPRRMVGITAGSMIGRGWLVAIAIFVGFFVSGQDDHVGLGAAVLVIVLFSAYFAATMIVRPFETNHSREIPS